MGIFGWDSYEPQKSLLLDHVNCKRLLPRLKEEATFRRIEL